MISFEIVEESGKMESYFAQWDQLFDSGAYEASLSLEWTRALLKTHLDGASFLLLVLRDEADVLGIVPLCIRERKKYGISLSTAFPISEYFNTHSDLLLRDSLDELVEVFLKALFSLKSRWDVLTISRFIENSPRLDRILQTRKNSFGFTSDVRREEPSFFIPLGDRYQEFLDKKSANFRSKLKSAAKKVQALGEVSFLRTRDFPDFDEAYRIILSIEEKSWKHGHGTAITCTERQREFYRELGRGAFGKGRMRLHILCVNREPAAFEMGLVIGKKYYCVHGSYDEKYKKENPGTVLLARFIEELVQDGITEYDWFGEPFEWESRWTDAFRWHTSLAIYNNTLKAKLLFLYHRIRKKLDHEEPKRLVLRNPRDIRPE
jgi:CelD/BcsL family acetyltransferase involved in cellulose biosynthesis